MKKILLLAFAMTAEISTTALAQSANIGNQNQIQAAADLCQLVQDKKTTAQQTQEALQQGESPEKICWVRNGNGMVNIQSAYSIAAFRNPTVAKLLIQSGVKPESFNINYVDEHNHYRKGSNFAIALTTVDLEQINLFLTLNPKYDTNASVSYLCNGKGLDTDPCEKTGTDINYLIQQIRYILNPIGNTRISSPGFDTITYMVTQGATTLGVGEQTIPSSILQYYVEIPDNGYLCPSVNQKLDLLKTWNFGAPSSETASDYFLAESKSACPSRLVFQYLLDKGANPKTISIEALKKLRKSRYFYFSSLVSDAEFADLIKYLASKGVPQK